MRGGALMTGKAVRHYLSHHAEREAELASRIDRRFRAVVVMPASGEGDLALTGLAPLREADGLAIVVVNARDDHPGEVHEQNAELIRTLCDSRTPPAAGYALVRRRGVDVLVIDRASPGRRLPARQGVGLARKIGCDAALALWAGGKVASRFIHWADADAELPRDFFDAAERAPKGAAALCYRFEHVACGDDALDSAHARYECYLRYYRLGLEHAGSPYAHHTIGSALAFDAQIYAAVRGVPRLLAAEDFYAVNKASKLGPVVTPDSAPIRIRARHSNRVPFGTGRATRDILANDESSREFTVDHPKIFGLLGAWLAALDAAALARSTTALSSGLESLDQSERTLLERALETLRAREAVAEALADRSAPNLHRRLHDWFDAFRTLKLIHATGALGLHELGWSEALRLAPFTRITARDPESCRHELARLDQTRLGARVAIPWRARKSC